MPGAKSGVVAMLTALEAMTNSEGPGANNYEFQALCHRAYEECRTFVVYINIVEGQSVRIVYHCPFQVLLLPSFLFQALLGIPSYQVWFA